MSSKEKNARHEVRLDLMASEENLIVTNGEDYPFTLDELISCDEDKSYCIKALETGLSAFVFKIGKGDEAYALKVEREKSLVNNLDGKTAFINELLVRHDIEKFRNERAEFPNLIKTYYADKNEGLVLSNWINGETPYYYNRERFRSLFEGLFELEQVGYFEWDLCPANLMFDKNDQITFYDFGYTYPFDLLKQIHSDNKDNMAMHMVERFETRAFVQHMIDVEKVLGQEVALSIYRVEKEEALRIHKKKLTLVIDRGGDDFVVSFLKDKIKELDIALSKDEELENLYIAEMFRSSLFDVYDDLSAPLASLDTYSKILRVVDAFNLHGELIRKMGYLFFGDEEMPDHELMEKYEGLQAKVEGLLKEEHKVGHMRWKERSYEVIRDYYDRSENE